MAVSLLVDSPAEPFKCSSQSVDFILKIIFGFPLVLRPHN